MAEVGASVSHSFPTLLAPAEEEERGKKVIMQQCLLLSLPLGKEFHDYHLSLLLLPILG